MGALTSIFFSVYLSASYFLRSEPLRRSSDKNCRQGRQGVRFNERASVYLRCACMQHSSHPFG